MLREETYASFSFRAFKLLQQFPLRISSLRSSVNHNLNREEKTRLTALFYNLIGIQT